jgi:hypothetical protein
MLARQAISGAVASQTIGLRADYGVEVPLDIIEEVISRC